MAEQITYKLITPIEFEVILKKLKQKKPDVLKILNCLAVFSHKTVLLWFLTVSTRIILPKAILVKPY